MARVLITALGTGRLISKTRSLDDAKASRDYDPVIYLIKDGESPTEYTTSYIAEALIQHFAIERVFVLGTAKSMWEQFYYRLSGDECDDDYYLELGQKIADSNHKNYLYDRSYLKPVEKALDRKHGCDASACYLVKYGLNREELLFNFELLLGIVEELQPGDELYVDITHSFRSLAIFQYMMTSFIENLNDKEIKIAKILYGMLDIIKEMGGKAPVVDLSVVNELNHWIKAIYGLGNYGYGYLAADLLREQKPDLADGINDLSDRINMNFLKDIRNERRRRLWKGLKDVDGPGRIATDAIQRSLKLFSSDQSESDFQLSLARWYFRQKRYATGYLTLYEAIVTRLVEQYGSDVNSWEERQDIKKYYKGRKNDYLHGLGALLEEVNDIRNQIAHSAGGSEDKYRSAVANCLKYCDQAERAFKQIGKTTR
jgi:CRISPR-associated Csx2 family protein